MSSLPGLLGEIADIVGPTTALEIARAVGGTAISIPPRARPDHWLTDLVGFDKADAICQGLATLDPEGRIRGISDEILPLGPASLQKRARQKAAAALEAGKSVTAAARESGLHERTVYRMKAEDDRQGKLF